MATPPTFSSYTQVADWQVQSTAARTVAGVSWAAGDDVYVIGGTADGVTTFTGVPTASGLTFTQIAAINGGTGAGTTAYLWVAHAGSAGSSVTISSSTLNNANSCAGISVLVVSGSDGAGTPVAGFAGTARSLSLTRVADNSGVLFINFDWTAENPAPTAWTPAGQTQRTATGDGINYGVEIATWGDQAAAGTTSYGQTGTATSDKWSKIAVEIKGTAGGAAVVLPAVQRWPRQDQVGGPWPRLQLAMLAPVSTADVRDHDGTMAEAPAMYATEQKVAIQGGVCGVAGAGTAAEKKVQAQGGISTAAPATAAAEKKVGVETGVSVAGGAATSVETSGTIASERGTLTAAAAAYATERKVAVQGGSCAAAAAATSSAKKVATPQGSTATAGGAATSVEKKIGKESGTSAAGPATTGLNGKKVAERGTMAAAATSTSIETSGQVASERGTSTAAAASYATEKKVAVQSGRCSAGATATSTSRKVATEAGTSSAAPATTGICRKVAKATGTCTAGASSSSVQAKRVSQSGRLCAAATTTGLLVSPFRTLPSRVSTLERKHRAETGDARYRVSTLDRRFRVSTE